MNLDNVFLGLRRATELLRNGIDAKFTCQDRAPGSGVEYQQGSLELNYPAELSSPENRILSALWMEGEQCYCNLRLRTGLAEADLRSALRGLLEREIIGKHSFGQNSLQSTADGVAPMNSSFTFYLKS